MNPIHKQQLDDDGFVLLPGYMTPDLLAELRHTVDSLYAAEGASAGSEFRKEKDTDRLANLVDKGEVFRRIISDPVILEYVAAVIPEPFKLGSFNGRAPHPNSDWV